MRYIQKLASTGADTVDGGSAKEKPTSEIDEAVSSLLNVVTDANVDLSLSRKPPLIQKSRSLKLLHHQKKQTR